MKVILAAGGSGGHIFPSVALAGELEKKGVEEIFFVSSKRRLDTNILKDCKYSCFFLSVNPMPLKFRPIRMLTFIFNLLCDGIRSAGLVFKIRPDVVVGFGGYSSGAIVLVSKLCGIPVIIHEQNYFPGRANKILGKIADKIAISFYESEKYLSDKKGRVVHTGNPLRLDILTNNRATSALRLGLAPEKTTIFIMGGSQGSSFLNRTASRAVLNVKEKYPDTVQIVHITGSKDHETIREFYDDNDVINKTVSFMERIDDAYAVSDIVVSRSGAAAVFELAYYGKAMILVPYPNPKNNQRSNAVYFEEKGAAVYKEESEISEDMLAREILDLLEDPDKRTSIGKRAGKLALPDAGKSLAEEVIRLGNK